MLSEKCQKNNVSPLPTYQTKKIGGEEHTPIWMSKVTLYNGKKYTGEPRPNKMAAEMSAAEEAYKKDPILSSKQFTRKCDDDPSDYFFIQPKPETSRKKSYQKQNISSEKEIFSENPESVSDTISNSLSSKHTKKGQIPLPQLPTIPSEHHTEIFVDVENKHSLSVYIIDMIKEKKVNIDIKITFVISESYPNKINFENEIKPLCNKNVIFVMVKGNAGFLNNSSDMAITILASRVNQKTKVVIVTGDKFATLLSLVGNSLDMTQRITHISTEKELNNTLL